MKSAQFRFEALGDQHDRAAFRCGEEVLDRYFREQATQDVRRHVANCFVAVEILTGVVAGYYTLSASSIPLIDLPPDEVKRLPRYPTLPAVRIGRLAVDTQFHRRGIGAAMLMNVAHRTLQGDVAAWTLLVDAKNDNAIAFYRHLGFQVLVSQPRTLFLPLTTANKALLKDLL